MKRACRTAILTLAALSVALVVPQTLAAQTPGNGPPAANGPPRPPRMEPDPRAQQKSYTLPTGEEMKYTLFVSSKVKPGVPAPLVVALHGYGGDSNFIVRDKLIDEAEAGGYVVVGPMGYNFTGWYGSPVILIGGGEIKPSNMTQLSELDVLNVMAIAQHDYTIDPNRIYLMGHSMGGAGTIFMGQKHSEIWAAAAAIAPAAFMMQPTEKTLLGHFKEAKLPLMITQGAEDNVVPPAGTRTWAAAMKELGVEGEYIEKTGLDHGTIIGPSMDDIFRFFAAHKRTPPPPFVPPRRPGAPPPPSAKP